MINIFKLYEDFQYIIAVTVGSILQILFTENLNIRLFVTILFSSLLVGLYIMYPLSCFIISEFDIKGKASVHLTNALLSISGFTSLFIVKIILNLLTNGKWISTAIKTKIAKSIGIDPAILLKEDNIDENNRQ